MRCWPSLFMSGTSGLETYAASDMTHVPSARDSRRARVGRLAQLVEHRFYTPQVGGSIPSPPTILLLILSDLSKTCPAPCAHRFHEDSTASSQYRVYPSARLCWRICRSFHRTDERLREPASRMCELRWNAAPLQQEAVADVDGTSSRDTPETHPLHSIGGAGFFIT